MKNILVSDNIISLFLGLVVVGCCLALWAFVHGCPKDFVELYLITKASFTNKLYLYKIIQAPCGCLYPQRVHWPPFT